MQSLNIHFSKYPDQWTVLLTYKDSNFFYALKGRGVIFNLEYGKNISVITTERKIILVETEVYLLTEEEMRDVFHSTECYSGKAQFESGEDWGKFYWE